MGTYERGGIALQVKESVVRSFKPLAQALKEPGEFLLSDFSKFDRPPKLHLMFQVRASPYLLLYTLRGSRRACGGLEAGVCNAACLPQLRATARVSMMALCTPRVLLDSRR